MEVTQINKNVVLTVNPITNVVSFEVTQTISKTVILEISQVGHKGDKGDKGEQGEQGLPVDPEVLESIDIRLDTLEIFNTYLPVYNNIINSTGFSLTDQNLTINSGWEWLIVGVNYTNPAAVVINIPFAEIGKQRIDLIVMNQSNTFQRIAGTESISNPVAPPMPKDKLQATLIVVSDGAISEPLQPIVGSDYILKQESYDFLVSYYDAVIEQVDLNDHRAVLNFMGTNTDVKSIALSGEFMRNGKIFTFKNHNATPLTIWHNSGTGNVKLLFPNEENFVLQPKEVIQFSLNYYDTSIPRLEYIGVISNNNTSTYLYNVFKFIQKGFGNTNQTIAESGDIYCGWRNDGLVRYTEASYISGALNNSDNFIPLVQTEI